MAINKDQILDQVMKDISTCMKGEVVGKYEDLASKMDVNTLTTGSIGVDSILGGGFPKGRLSLIVGMSSTGKTTLALTAIAELQKKNPDAKVLYIDSECALDPYYATSLGVDINKVYFAQPSTGEKGYEIVERFLASGAMDLVVVDSIAAMLPQVLIDQEYAKDSPIGALARLNARAIPRINRMASQFGTTVIFINQYKKAVRINPYDTGDSINGTMFQPGGSTQLFYMSQILEIKKAGRITENNEVVGNITKVFVRKNKISAPYRTAEFIITFGKGLNKTAELITLCRTHGLIKAGGAWLRYNNATGAEVAKQGILALSSYLDSPEGAADREFLYTQLRTKLIDAAAHFDFKNINSIHDDGNNEDIDDATTDTNAAPEAHTENPEDDIANYA